MPEKIGHLFRYTGVVLYPGMQRTVHALGESGLAQEAMEEMSQDLNVGDIWLSPSAVPNLRVFAAGLLTWYIGPRSATAEHYQNLGRRLPKSK